MKKIFYKKEQPFICIALCFALICWIFLFAQIISNYFLAPVQKAIPAFQSEAAISSATPSMITYSISDFSISQKGKFPDQNTIYTFLKRYDKNIKLVSYHKENNYTDLYFYSPLLQQNTANKSNGNYNIQAAITNTKVYFGTPFINFDF